MVSIKATVRSPGLTLTISFPATRPEPSESARLAQGFRQGVRPRCETSVMEVVVDIWSTPVRAGCTLAKEASSVAGMRLPTLP